MKKRIMILLCCIIIAIAGCGSPSSGTGQEASPVVEKSLGAVSYQVPEDWVEASDPLTGVIYYRTDGYVLEVSRAENMGLEQDYLAENMDAFAGSMVEMIVGSKSQFSRMFEIETIDTVKLTDNNGDLEYDTREIADIKAFEGRVNFLIDDAEYQWHANVFIYEDGIYLFAGVSEAGKDYSKQYDAVVDSIEISTDQSANP